MPWYTFQVFTNERRTSIMIVQYCSTSEYIRTSAYSYFISEDLAIALQGRRVNYVIRPYTVYCTQHGADHVAPI